jgi:hypothetical protein
MQLYSEYRPTTFDPTGLGLDDRQTWLVLPVIRTRDSGPLEESNFDAAVKSLGGESETLEIHRFGHWGPGWFEIAIIDPSRAAEGEQIESALAHYPVLDDSDLSEREYDAAQESWDCWGAREFVGALAAAFELAEDTVTWLHEHHSELWRLHMDHSPYAYESSDDGASFDFRYVADDSEPSRATLARFIRDTRAADRAPKSNSV